MYNLQATLREITVEVMTIQEITVEVLDLPMFLDLSPTTQEVVDMLPNDLDFEIDPFPTLSPRDLGLHIDNSILHA